MKWSVTEQATVLEAESWCVDIGKPIFALGTVRTIRWWQRWLLWFLPTDHYIEDGIVVVSIKYWRGTAYIWAIRP